MKLTSDIKAEWEPLGEDLLNVLRRLQSASRTNGCAVLRVIIAVDADGIPHCWTEPEVIKLEPKARATELLRLLCE